jgi:uncharacterized membrane protein
MAAAVLGVVSLVSLVAAFIWAHHWNPLTAAIVAIWGLSTIAGLFASIRSLGERGMRARKRGRIGLTLTAFSLLALFAVGVGSAFGADPGAMCGGG